MSGLSRVVVDKLIDYVERNVRKDGQIAALQEDQSAVTLPDKPGALLGDVMARDAHIRRLESENRALTERMLAYTQCKAWKVMLLGKQVIPRSVAAFQGVVSFDLAHGDVKQVIEEHEENLRLAELERAGRQD